MARWCLGIGPVGRARAWIGGRWAWSFDELVLWGLVFRLLPGLLLLFFGYGVILDLGRWFPGILLIAVGVAHLVPGTTRRILLHFGFARLASWQAATDGLAWGRDPIGGRLATLALGHLRAPGDLPLAARLDGLLLTAGRMSAGVVLAAGIRSFTKGDREDARRLWRLVAAFDPTVRAVEARVLAIDLLAAEAADTGDLGRMLRELDGPWVPRTALGDLLRACAKRVAGERIPEGVLRATWLLAGRWTSTGPLLDRIRARGPAPPSAGEPGVPAVDGLLPAALLATARLGSAAQAPPRSEVRAAAELWERVLASEDDVARIRSRAAGRAEPVGELRAQVLEVLAERLARSPDPGVDTETGGPLFREVVWRCADRRDERLEWLATELGHRTDARRALPLVDEVRAWCRLVEAFEQVVAVSPERASASFPKLYYPVVRHTVWLHNERKQATIANAMYRVMLRYAVQVTHDSGQSLLAKNLACGP